MKYILTLLAALALAGTGCLSTRTTIMESDTGSRTDTSSAESSTTTETEETTEVEIETVPITEVILGEETSVEVEMEVENFSFTPNTITASPGDRIQVTFTKSSGIHTFVIDEIDLDFPITQGEAVIFTVPDEPGEYSFYCDIGSHRSLGLEGTLIVE